MPIERSVVAVVGGGQIAIIPNAGLLFAAGAAWNPEAASESASVDALGEVLDRRAFGGDLAPGAGRALLELGRVAEVTGAASPNASPLSLVLTTYPGPLPPPQAPDLTPAGLERALAQLEAARASFPGPCTASSEGALLAREFRFATDALSFAGRLGLQRFENSLGNSSLGEEALALAREHRSLWLSRSRPGGLDASAAWFERISQGLLA